MNRKHSLITFVIVLTLLAGVAATSAQGQRPQGALGTAFTYQGQLKNASGPVNDPCDFQFGLWDALTSPAAGNPLEVSCHTMVLAAPVVRASTNNTAAVANTTGITIRRLNRLFSFLSFWVG